MDKRKLMFRIAIVALGLLALLEGWSLATAPRPAPPEANLVGNVTGQ